MKIFQFLIFMVSLLPFSSFAESRTGVVTDTVYEFGDTYRQSISQGGASGLVAKALADIENIENKIESDDYKLKNGAKEYKFPSGNFPDDATNLFNNDYVFPLSDELKQIVKERGPEAKQKLHNSESLIMSLKRGQEYSGDDVWDYPEIKKYSDDLLDDGKTKIPNEVALLLFLNFAEGHFAKALLEDSDVEFARGIGVLDTLSWQATTNPDGYIIDINNLPPKDGTLRELSNLVLVSFDPNAGYECRNDSDAECIFDALMSLPAFGGGKWSTLKNVVEGGGKELAEEGGEKAAKGGTTLGRKRTKDSDNFDDYVDVAKGRGDNYFDIPYNVWNKMTRAEQRAANRKFLDEAIDRGDIIYLAAENAPVNGTYSWEIYYLLDHGYKFNKDATKLIPK